MKGDERANELWTSRISSEFERASPRNCKPPQHQRLHGQNGEFQDASLPYLGREGSSKFLELFQLRADLDLVLLVQQHREQSLSTTGILDCLRSKEKIG